MELDPRLQNDGFELGRTGFCRLLRMNNRSLPWFVLVPSTACTEICDLPAGEQAQLWAEVNSIAAFVRQQYAPDKLNIAAIGNVVSQLHVHVVGRYHDDYCWPGVVWGAAGAESFPEAASAGMLAELRESLGELLV